MRRDLTRLLSGALVAAVVIGAYATWRIWEQGDRDEQRPADAIVVLGAAQYDGLPSPVFQARLDHAVALHLAGLAPVLVVTGGKQANDRTTEAAAARAFAIANGVDAGAILVEDRSRNTLESIRAVGAMLRERGLTRVVFVSDRSHMLRVLRFASDEGLTAYGSPTRTSPTDATLSRRVERTVHELGALAVYFLSGEQPARDPAT